MTNRTGLRAAPKKKEEETFRGVLRTESGTQRTGSLPRTKRPSESGIDDVSSGGASPSHPPRGGCSKKRKPHLEGNRRGDRKSLPRRIKTKKGTDYYQKKPQRAGPKTLLKGESELNQLMNQRGTLRDWPVVINGNTNWGGNVPRLDRLIRGVVKQHTMGHLGKGRKSPRKGLQRAPARDCCPKRM